MHSSGITRRLFSASSSLPASLSLARPGAMADERLIRMDITSIPPAYVLLAEEVTASIVYLLLPTAFIYLAIYVYVRGHASLFKLFTFASVVGFWASSWVAPISCGPARCVQNFAGTLCLLTFRCASAAAGH